MTHDTHQKVNSIHLKRDCVPLHPPVDAAPGLREH